MLYTRRVGKTFRREWGFSFSPARDSGFFLGSEFVRVGTWPPQLWSLTSFQRVWALKVINYIRGIYGVPPMHPYSIYLELNGVPLL